jgi:hypothetical protein
LPSTYFRIYEIPERFGNTSTSNHTSSSFGDNRRKGVFSVNVTADAEFSNYLETDAVRRKDAEWFSTVKKNVVLLSGWLSLGDKFLTW